MIRYEEYKSTQYEWLGEVPAHWELKRNRLLFTESKDAVGSNSEAYTLLSLTLKGIIPRDLENLKGKFPESFDKYKIVRPNDIAFCLFDVDETPRTVGLSTLDGMLTDAYTIMHVNGVSPKYLFYLYLAIDNQKGLRPLYKGLRKTIPVSSFMSIESPVPPLAEQEQIVRYLDWKVAEIKKQISIRKRQISLIHEHLRYTINKAVTHGIGEEELKDSKIYWLGNIPKSWETIKIKWLFNEDNERNDEGIEELLTFSRKKGLIPFSEASDKEPSTSDLTTYRVVKPGQLLENRMQAWSGMFICVTRNGCVSPEYSVFNPSAERYVNVKFYEYVFRNPLQVEQFANASRGVGSGFNRLYTPAFGAIYTVYPPREEQDAIVELLDSIQQKHKEVIKRIEKEIECLHDMQDRIVFDAITGKIDVRNVEIPEYELTVELSDAFEDNLEPEEFNEGQED